MARKRSSGGGGGCPLWMMTFGDCMSLLVTFFVMLISFTNLEQERLLEMIGALKGALGVAPSFRVEEVSEHRVTGESPLPRWMSLQDLSAVLPDARMRVRRFGRPRPGEIRPDVIVRMLDDGMAFLVNADPMFEPGRAVLLPGSEELFRQVGGFLGEFLNEVRVIGVMPADAQSLEAEARTPQGLGLARAMVVQERLSEAGRLEPERFGVGARLLRDGEAESLGLLPAEHIEIVLVGRDPARDVSPEAIVVKDKWR